MQKIINVDNIIDLQCPFKTYWEIINFFKRFSKEWFLERNIYFEQHHIYPRAEIGCDFPIIVNLPYKYHFLAHYYRAAESTDSRIKFVNFKACQVMIGKNKNIEYIKNCFPKEFYKAKEWVLNNPNNCKKIINLQTKEVYASIIDCSRKTSIRRGLLRHICSNPNVYYATSCYKIKYFSFFDESYPMGYYENLLKIYESIPHRTKKSWSKENIKKRASHMKGVHFIQSKSKKVIDLSTKIIYSSTTDAERATKIERHKILKSCRDNQPVKFKNKIYNFRYLENINNNIDLMLTKSDLKFLEKSKLHGTLVQNKLHHLKTKNGYYYRSISDMARLTGMSRTTIQRRLGFLVFNI